MASYLNQLVRVGGNLQDFGTRTQSSYNSGRSLQTSQRNISSADRDMDAAQDAAMRDGVTRQLLNNQMANLQHKGNQAKTANQIGM